MKSTFIVATFSFLTIFLSIAPPTEPAFSPAPSPTAGGPTPTPSRASHMTWRTWVSSSPSHSPLSTVPLLPTEGAPTQAVSPPVGAPVDGAGGVPFLSSNPAVPLPTGVTDSQSFRPLSTPGDASQVVGMGSSSSIRNGKELLIAVFALFVSSTFLVWL